VPARAHITIIASLAIIAILSASTIGITSFSDTKTKLIDVSDTRNGITFKIQLIESSTNLAFSTRIDTHTGALAFDLVDVVSIVSGNARALRLEW
jgi:hypothetical protein